MNEPQYEHSRNPQDSDFRRSLLEAIALFRKVDPDDVIDIMPRCGRVDVAAGEILLSPDRENRCIYVVLSGALRVHLGSLDAPKLADLPPGSCAGEMSLIEDKDPSAYVVAEEDSHLMVIDHGLLWQLINRSHTFAKNLLIVLSERVRSDNEYIASSLDSLRRANLNAITDALTGLGNRHWMNDKFQRELMRRRDGEQPACLMMIDIDNFKQYNDQYGHIAGDQVLASVGGTLSACLRPTDLIARFGGDEFAALLPGISLDEAEKTANRLLERIAALTPASLESPITVSIGVACTRPDDDVESIVERADDAMYQSKNAGRNRVTVTGP